MVPQRVGGRMMPTVVNQGIETAAELFELIERLGDIPPERVLLRPTPGEATEDDLLDHMSRTGRICELVDSVLVEKAMGQGESGIAGWIMQRLMAYVDPRDLGYFIPEAGMTRLRPGIVRAPDLSFIRWDRVNGQIDMARIRELMPDLAVEVISADNTKAEIDRKIGEYFLAGIEAVWVVDPFRRVFVIHTTPEDFVTLAETDTLEGGPVFPGLDLPLSKIFERVPPTKRRSRRKKP